MLFNTVEFRLFFALVYAAYLLLPRMGQNMLLLATSYFFILVGKRNSQDADPGGGKKWVTISIMLNLRFLGFFKYFSFLSIP